MSKQISAIRCAAGAAAVAALLALPVLSVAQGHERLRHARVAGMHAKKPRHSYFARDEGYRYGPYAAAPSAAAQSGRCAWPYQNLYPPCMSTYPQGSPDYHGTPR
jgi:hypothetical protein